MDQKQFEDRLDGLADTISKTVSEGVRKVEDAFERGRTNLDAETLGEGSNRRKIGSPRTGVVLLAIGIVWLLNSFDIFDHRIFPILMVAAGLYFIIRDKNR